jgi:hypothetical protein
LYEGYEVLWKATYADQDALALEVDIGDCELVGERHGEELVEWMI